MFLWRSPLTERLVLVAGTVAALCGLITIWIARLTIPYSVYVSGLGATGMPTAGAFAFALLSIAAAAVLIASRSTHVRSRIRWLAAWTPAATLALAAACFVVASQVTCTAGCPVPLANPVSTVQDLVHTVTAVLGFAAACFAMLQVAFAEHQPALTLLSVFCCCSVAAITITGGLLSIFQVAIGVGAWLEFTGATIALAWLVAYGISLACAHRAPAEPPRRTQPAPAVPFAITGNVDGR